MKNWCYILLFPLLFSCQGENKDYLPGYSGRVGELVVVIDNKQWEGQMGEAIRNTFATAMFGLPQPEERFHVINIPERSFNSTFQTHRNLLIINVPAELKGEEAEMEIKTNSWSKGQLVVKISAKDGAAFSSFVKENEDRLVALYNNKEINRLVKRNQKHGPKNIVNELNGSQQLSITAQQDMELRVNNEKIAWLRLQRERNAGGYMHQVNQDVLIFQQSYTDTTQLTPENILAYIDSVAGMSIPGPNDSSYFSISYKYINPQAQITEHNGQYAVILKGLWRMENGFMGGPFVSLTTLDQSGQRLITALGYVYAPQFPKREYLREVEAVVLSLEG